MVIKIRNRNIPPKMDMGVLKAGSPMSVSFEGRGM